MRTERTKERTAIEKRDWNEYELWINMTHGANVRLAGEPAEVFANWVQEHDDGDEGDSRSDRIFLFASPDDGELKIAIYERHIQTVEAKKKRTKKNA